MTNLKVLALVVGMVLLFAIPATLSAQRLPPHVFVGSMINGAAATDGTVITARVNDAQVATATVVDGNFVLIVDQGDDSYAGMMVSFTVDGMMATETANWMQGGGDVLNLTGVSGSGGGGGGDTGAKGPTGPRGATGATGAAGSPGPAGAAGSDGSDGSAGPAGSSGSTGSAGSAGPAGPAGAEGDDGGGALGLIALIVAIVALLAAGGSYMMGRRA